ncbi:hypothetical protein WA158_006533 [Blastocystis sp. Blastoise]
METTQRKPNILVGVCGSVAAVKIPEIILCLSEFANIKVLISKSAEHFLACSKEYNPSVYNTFEEKKYELYYDCDEWNNYNHVKSDKVLHVELRKWADIYLICPLTANTLAKLSTGLCDTLIICPAMNTYMYDHPITKSQLNILHSWGIQCIEPICKVLACGDQGKGALATVDTIVKVCKQNVVYDVS